MPDAQIPDAATPGFRADASAPGSGTAKPASTDVTIEVTPEPGAAEPVERATTRRRRVMVGTLLVICLAGATALGTTGWRILGQADAVLNPPAEVAGLIRDDSKRARDAVGYLRTVLAANIELTDSVGAVYTDPAAADRSVLLFGGTTLLWRPERTLDRLFELVAPGSARGLRSFPAGRLSGVLKCASTSSPDAEIAICGWADHGSVAFAMFPGRQVDESASLLRQIREATQTRK